MLYTKVELYNIAISCFDLVVLQGSVAKVDIISFQADKNVEVRKQFEDVYKRYFDTYIITID